MDSAVYLKVSGTGSGMSIMYIVHIHTFIQACIFMVNRLERSKVTTSVIGIHVSWNSVFIVEVGGRGRGIGNPTPVHVCHILPSIFPN